MRFLSRSAALLPPAAAAVLLASSSPTSSSSAAAFVVPAVPTHRPSFRRSVVTALGETAEGTTKGNVLDGRDIDGDFAPINNMILVRKAETVDTTEGGIILTGKQKITKSEGVVVAAGPGRTNLETGYQSPMPVSPGEKVLFGKYDGTEVTYNGAKHTLIRDDDVLVKFPSLESSDLDDADVLWDAVLVKVPKIEEEKSSSGILFAKTSSAKKTKSSVGEVVKVGPGRYAYNGVLMEMDVSPGDNIKYRDFAAQEVEIGEEEFAVVRMTDVLAKF